MTEEIYGIWEAAEFLGITRQAIFLRRKNSKFPEPYRELKMGPVWLHSQLEPLKNKKSKRDSSEKEKANRSFPELFGSSFSKASGLLEAGGLSWGTKIHSSS